MADFLQQYQLLLDQATQHPDWYINRYLLLTESARASLPDPALPLSTRWEGPIFERLDAWAEKLPQKIAVSDINSQWSYQAVKLASNQLAQFLRQNGVQNEDIVAIYGHRCAALVPAIIGILKAGAAFLLLDPSHPESRLKQYLIEANPVGWLSFSSSAPTISVNIAALKIANGCQMSLPLQPETWFAQLNQFPQKRPAVFVKPDDRACVTFTSGSTGKPKGINGCHRSLTHFYPWMTHRFQLSEMDRFSMLSGLAHDPLQRDIFTAIWVGAEICVPDKAWNWQSVYLPNWLKETGVTVMHLIPSMIQMLTAADTTFASSSLRLAFFVGEPLKRHQAKQFKQIFPNTNVINFYGTSETQRAVSYYPVTWQQPRKPLLKQEIPLGRGMPGSQLLVLNEEYESAGIGELGELYMRSPHLALGYLGDEEATTAAFLQAPWQTKVEDRIYRTGDFGRYLPDGQVTFAGRRDTQVNIRGFRAELSEIEAVLTANSSIKSAVVKVATPLEDKIHIIAYIVKESTQEKLSSQQIQAIVKEKLPTPMVPTNIIFLEEIPLTPNGKIDHRALPQPDLTESVQLLPVAPRDDIEETLLSIWQELLPATPSSIHDEFFALGGHSILAIQMFSRIHHEFGVDLNIGLLFRYTSIAELAGLIRNQITSITAESILDSAKLASNLIQIRTGDLNQPSLYCVHGAGGHVMFMQKWQPYFEDWPIYGFEFPGVDGESWPSGNLEALATDYVSTLHKAKSRGPVILCGYSGGGVIAFEMAQQLKQNGETVSLLVLIDTYHPNVRSRPHTWKEKWHRLRHQTKTLVRDLWKRHIVDPIMFKYITNRYVKQNKPVPIEFRRPILEYFYFRIKRQYKPTPYSGNVLLVRSKEVMPIFDHISPQLGWDNLLTNLKIVELPGNHFTIVDEPYVSHLAQAIEEAWKTL